MKAEKEKQKGLGTKYPLLEHYQVTYFLQLGSFYWLPECHQIMSSSDSWMTVSIHDPTIFPKFHLNTNAPGSSLSM